MVHNQKSHFFFNRRQIISVDFAGRYNWVINNTDLDAIKELRVTSIKKY